MSDKILKNSDRVSIADRFEFGYFTIEEVAELKAVSRSLVYEDIKAKRLPVEKFGRLTRIAGVIAKQYTPGRALAAA